MMCEKGRQDKVGSEGGGGGAGKGASKEGREGAAWAGGIS